MKMQMTQHVLNDRMERMLYIAEHVGWGEVIMEVENSATTCMCLTSTGVVLVKNLHRDTLITAYLPNRNDLIYMCRALGYSRIPTVVENKMRKNHKHYLVLAQMY